MSDFGWHSKLTMINLANSACDSCGHTCRRRGAAAGEPLVPPPLGHRHEGHEVHPLVLGLLQQHTDPAVAVLEATERAEVEQHMPPTIPGGRHSCHRLQHHRAAPGWNRLTMEEDVSGHAQRLDGPVGDLRLVVLIFRSIVVSSVYISHGCKF